MAWQQRPPTAMLAVLSVAVLPFQGLPQPGIAPLLPSGQQPPTASALPAGVAQQWQPPPFVGPPKSVAVAPLTLVYGSPPVPHATFGVALVQQQWQPPWMSSVPPVTVAPLTLPTGAQPAARSALAFPTTQGPALAWSVPPPIVVAPLTLVYGTPPAPQSAIAFPASQGPVVAWRVPPPVTVAPVTLVYGSQPAPRALPVPQWLGVPWSLPQALQSASWNVPVLLAQVPHTRRAPLILASLPLPWSVPPALPIAPLTLRYGQQPPRNGLFTVQAFALLSGQWPSQGWPQPHAPYVVQPLILLGGSVLSGRLALVVPMTAGLALVIPLTGNLVTLAPLTGSLTVNPQPE